MEAEKRMKQRAFTLIELLIVIAIAVIIAGALVPLFSVTKQDAKLAKAMSEMEAIKAACQMMHQDTGEWPVLSNTGTDIVNNNRNLVDWSGPYLDRWPNDPWGLAYSLYMWSGILFVATGEKNNLVELSDPRVAVTGGY